MPRGRPDEYTPEVGKRICEGIAEGKSMVEVCEPADMPARSTVYLWMQKHPDFSDNLARAREASAYAFEDDQHRYRSELETTREMVRVHALREASYITDRLQRIRAPRTHSETNKHEHTGQDGKPLTVVVEIPKDVSSSPTDVGG